jgi:methyl-accepting chemotaxis protein-1 (serine sensor receptor)
MKNLKIGTRMTITFAALVFLLLMIAGVALSKLSKMGAATTKITDDWLPRMELINSMDKDLASLRLHELNHVMNSDGRVKAAAEASVNELQLGLNNALTAYKPRISSPDEQDLYDAFVKDHGLYLGATQRLFDLSRQHENIEALALLGGDSNTLYTSASNHLRELVTMNSRRANAEGALAARVYADSWSAMAGAGSTAVVLATVAALWLVMSITRPLAQALQVAERVAAGDLTGEIEVTSRDETGHLLGALQRMQESLVNTVTAVRGNAQSVASASAKIAEGNSDLSSRTEQQASALQETAASMEELGATVRQNAESALTADQLAVTASSVAAQGGNVVAEVVETMKGINESSKRIAEIIGVIDGIAFQTNILALNAAVEAARAGEHGRGFAVVASEVRNLAARCAEAAKEIKTLIGISVARVDRGTHLVDQAGATMSEVVSAIRHVTEMMSEISASSAQQSQGVAQVGEAVTHLDQATQQNAALVEEIASSANRLSSQAEALVSAVEVFKLAHSDRAVSDALPATVVVNNRPSSRPLLASQASFRQ